MTQGQHDHNGDAFHRRPSDDNGTRIKRLAASTINHVYYKILRTVVAVVVTCFLGIMGWLLIDVLTTVRDDISAAVETQGEMSKVINGVATDIQVMISDQDDLEKNAEKHEVLDTTMHKVQWGEINNNRSGIADLRDRVGTVEGQIGGGE